MKKYGNKLLKLDTEHVIANKSKYRKQMKKKKIHKNSLRISRNYNTQTFG